jgi:hypothetical protein
MAFRQQLNDLSALLLNAAIFFSLHLFCLLLGFCCSVSALFCAWQKARHLFMFVTANST